MAYETALYVDQKNGNDADNGLTVALAKQTIEGAITVVRAGVVDTYTVFVLGGEFDESIVDINRDFRLVFLFGAKMKTSTLSYAISSGDSSGSGYEFYNIRIEGYATSYQVKLSTGTSNDPTVKWYNSYFDGIYYCGRGKNMHFYNCQFNGVTFTYSTSGNTNVLLLYIFENCTFYNCSDIGLIGSANVIGTTIQKNNIFIGSTITVNYFDEDLQFSNFYNCQFRFWDASTNFAGITTSYSSISTASELRAKRDSDLSVSTPGTYYESDIWTEPDLLDETNNNLYLSEDDPAATLSEKGRHVGFSRESIYIDSTQITAPSGGSTSNGYAESTAAPSTGIEFVCGAIEFDKARLIRSISAIIDIGNGGEIMSSQTEDINKRIIDCEISISATKTAAQLDASPEAYNTYEIGIVDTDLNFDEINEVAKSVKIKFTLKNEGVSTDFGEVKVYQIIVESEDYFFFDEDTDVVTQFEQLGSAQGNFIDEGGGNVYECVLLPQSDSEIDAATTGAYKIDDGVAYTYDEIVAIAAASPASGTLGHIAITYSSANPALHNIEKVSVTVDAIGATDIIKDLYTFNN